jgi:hypothetical protein
LQTEGLITLLKRGLSFFTGRYLFQYETFYLYEHTLKERNEADFLPRTKDFTFKVVSTKKQADELAAAGLNLDSYSVNAQIALEKGAIAFCIIIGKELASIDWAAMSAEAKKPIDSLPYYIDFSSKQAWSGGTWTNPKYREKGLMTYSYFKKFQFLKEKGLKSARNAVVADNTASQKVHAKFKPKIYAKARYFRILWWQYLKETPLKNEQGKDKGSYRT